MKKLDEPREPEGVYTFGNSVFSIAFPTRAPPSTPSRYGNGVYGHKYNFFLRDAVEDVPEYLVKWNEFVSLAKEEEFGLELVYKEEFHTIFMNEKEDKEFKGLLKTMRVVDSNGQSALDTDQWEAASK